MHIPAKYVVLCHIWVLFVLVGWALVGPQGVLAVMASLGALVTLLTFLVAFQALWKGIRQGWMAPPRAAKPLRRTVYGRNGLHWTEDVPETVVDKLSARKSQPSPYSSP